VLCITLKRFSWINRAKIDTKVDFPLQSLNMSKYTTVAINNGAKNCIYDLRSVVVHHGRSPNIGHYTSFSFNSSKGLLFFIIIIIIIIIIMIMIL
jgi:uncharacterized UBP type Zn finger protein